MRNRCRRWRRGDGIRSDARWRPGRCEGYCGGIGRSTQGLDHQLRGIRAFAAGEANVGVAGGEKDKAVTAIARNVEVDIYAGLCTFGAGFVLGEHQYRVNSKNAQLGKAMRPTPSIE